MNNSSGIQVFASTCFCSTGTACGNMHQLVSPVVVLISHFFVCKDFYPMVKHCRQMNYKGGFSKVAAVSLLSMGFEWQSVL